MKKIHGLENLSRRYAGILNSGRLAELLLNDLQQCRCHIYGCIGDDDKILLAEFLLIPQSLVFDVFDQRIDLRVSGPILRNDCVPLTYRLQGGEFAISGRCSMIGKVCGVDLYLQASYTGVIGDTARQTFAIAVKPLLKVIKST